MLLRPIGTSGATVAKQQRGAGRVRAARAPYPEPYPTGHVGPSVDTQKLRHNVELLYAEALGRGTPEVLPSICHPSVCYCDAHGDGGHDCFGLRGLAAALERCTSAHPLLRVVLDSVAFDPSGATATVEWHATAAHLLPGSAGVPPSGLVSISYGIDQLTFQPGSGLITSILSIRDRFAAEAAEAAASGAASGDG
ncbi:hypothetical protein Rsub_10707 [Raphidocelis subcapitata]|uniref:SnoaL-like domain-containing protein n=1 Tax=Raphidocelis subcapitata TaxID=307507 RepID=A0A2V0PLI8_9CHLO|nr:hypothetical protein Rsub_10707 [Raphidocelis subcapitata]|eukprot:GBF98207.1 hypothetical protein Rsub_10707 [Raphidocelis subcapitata]